MSKKFEANISPDFEQAYPYLAPEYDRQDAHDASQSKDVNDEDGRFICEGMSYADAMRIFREAEMPYVRVVPSIRGIDNFLEIL